MSERSYDVPKGASHRGVFFHNTITVGQWIESLNIKDKVICLHYATNPHEYHAKHDAMDGIGATMNRAILDWLHQKIDRDIERGETGSVLCRQCATEQGRSAEWNSFHYGTNRRCDACDREGLCAMIPNAPVDRAAVADMVKPIVRLRYPTATDKMAEIIAKLEDIDAHADDYCKEAVVDARHDLSVLEAAGLYKPNANSPNPPPPKKPLDTADEIA